MSLSDAQMQAVVEDMRDKLNSLEEVARELPSRWRANEAGDSVPFSFRFVTSAGGGPSMEDTVETQKVDFNPQTGMFDVPDPDSRKRIDGLQFTTNYLIPGDIVVSAQLPSIPIPTVLYGGRYYIAGEMEESEGTEESNEGSQISILILPIGIDNERTTFEDFKLFYGGEDIDPGVRLSYSYGNPLKDTDAEGNSLEGPLLVRGFLHQFGKWHCCFAPCLDARPQEADNQTNIRGGDLIFSRQIGG